MAGKISNCVSAWEQITSDRGLLNIVKYGYSLEFETDPCWKCNRGEIRFNEAEQKIIDELLQKFYRKNIIEEAAHEEGEVISNIFIRPKTDGTYRLILNLSNLNNTLNMFILKWKPLKVHFSLSHVTAISLKLISKMHILESRLQLNHESIYALHGRESYISSPAWLMV